MRHLMLTIAALTLLPVMSMAAEAGLARPTFLPADAQIL